MYELELEKYERKKKKRMMTMKGVREKLQQKIEGNVIQKILN